MTSCKRRWWRMRPTHPTNNDSLQKCTAQASAKGGRSFLSSFSPVKYTAGSQSADTEARGSEYLFYGRRTKGKCGRA